VTKDAMRAVSSATRAGIVDAGARCIIRDGVAHATMSAIAAECGVSKALLHYHFADRAQLLGESAQLLGRRLVTRERRALEHATAANAIEMLWQWQGREMERGELRALLELGSVRQPEVQEVIARIDSERRAAAAATVTTLFARLGLTPRVPAELIASATYAFMNGLAVGIHDEDIRTGFDVFWLAMLSLGD
jgi:AcrR family transcriptional regulator